jgi:hypothetical protein
MLVISQHIKETKILIYKVHLLDNYDKKYRVFSHTARGILQLLGLVPHYDER